MKMGEILIVDILNIVRYGIVDADDAMRYPLYIRHTVHQLAPNEIAQ